jgi:hypothetical protein
MMREGGQWRKRHGRDRQRQTETERQTETDRDRQRQTETDRDRITRPRRPCAERGVGAFALDVYFAKVLADAGETHAG